LKLIPPGGQIAYTSRITEQTEYLPVTAAALSQPGTDAFLMRLMDSFLTACGRPRVLKAGKEMFDRDSSFSEAPQVTDTGVAEVNGTDIVSF
jgi:hypothetical protein